MSFTMLDVLIFLLLATIGLPVISWAAARTQLYVTEVRIWNIRREIQAINKHTQECEERITVWAIDILAAARAITEEDMKAAAWKQEALTSMQVPPSPEQYQAFVAETDRWAARKREMVLRHLLLIREKKAIDATFAELRTRLDILHRAIDELR
jgi:hypothetical protein